ncbi:uncharacterized protein A4U43_C06F2110 [Asparagus officinalis]|uniref:Glutamate receptor n=1 Tax=Asparagus officinalis TaxID=4686 RepID=A0A5P1EIV6_ASPOF|nr:glutamate receptor 3.7-like [Asparagus officinalis]XP_020268952.1 glutamate receptor 3.7-like [Asparagus officinalis]ONK65898.1 uncharacterized protein A4U43_C06F2110 [Asparagus officinalis]
MYFLKFTATLILILCLSGIRNCEKPEVVNIGAVLTYDSIIGTVAKAAIEAAVADVNADKNILVGTRLNLIMENSDCNAFLGSIGALKVLERDVVTIIGPQSSTVARIVSQISSGLQIPLVSFAATDPTLSSLQYPFFIRMTQSDSYQMAAMADLINYYSWRQVIAIYVDDDYGRNGISFLDDELAKKKSNLYKFALPVRATRSYVMDVLRKSQVIGPRVYVVHANPDSGLEIFSVARELHMITDGYVWLATDWLCTVVGSSNSFINESLSYLQGAVGFCQHVAQSSQTSAFLSKWKGLRERGVVTSKLNAYGFYAYDTVWATAYAIENFLSESGNVTFSSNDKLVDMKGKMRLDKLKTFDDGNLLLQKLLLLDVTGLIGRIQFDADHNLKSGIYQIINIDGPMMQSVGFWTNNSDMSVYLPKSVYGNEKRSLRGIQLSQNITWPGGHTKTPRGWVAATKERPLRIVVPYRVSFEKFVTALNDNHTVRGYCIDVFEAAIRSIPYDVPHQFIPFGDGRSNPNYSELVDMVADGVVDAAVGDIAIVTDRSKLVDFTQPYISTGLVIVVPVESAKSSAWVFLRPFSACMWGVIGAFFFLIGIVIWVLEHRVNSDFRGTPKRQCMTIFLFSFSTLFQSQQEDTLSTLGRFVMMVWLFLLMVITSSYTASLTSFLTVQQLSSPINGIDSLIANNEPIGYQDGSFARSYMINSLNIHPKRLVPLDSSEAYAKVLQLGPKNGGVSAIVEELPYVELFLENKSGFGIVGQPFTRRGWGFAFPRESPLALDLSSAVLNLSENGELQRIHKKWFCQTSCSSHTATSLDPNQLQFSSFWGLFLVCGVAAILALLLFLLRAIRQFIRFNKQHRNPVEVSSTGCSHAVYRFFDFIDKKEEAIKNMFKQQNDPITASNL